jgi:Family of unknown function (DUF6416)
MSTPESSPERFVLPLGPGATLVLEAAAVVRVRAELAALESKAAKTPVPGPPLLLEEHPMWEHHSGGKNHHGRPQWREGDSSYAAALLMDLSGKARVFFELLLDRPGQLLDTHQLLRLAPGTFGSAKAIAGCLNGFVNPCRRFDRRFPFYWWDRFDGPTSYAVRPSVARVFNVARSRDLTGRTKRSRP